MSGRYARISAYRLDIMSQTSRWAAATLSCLLVVTSCSSTHEKAATSTANVVIGFVWNAAAIRDSTATYRYATPVSSDGPGLVFRPDGDLEGSDGVNYFSGGHYRLTAHGYHVTGTIGGTFVGYPPVANPAIDACRGAIAAAMNSGHNVLASADGTTLTVTARGYTITPHRGIPAGNPGPLVATTAASP